MDITVARQGGTCCNSALIRIYESSEVLTDINMRTSVFSIMVQCSLADRHQNFRGNCCLELQGRFLSSKFLRTVCM